MAIYYEEFTSTPATLVAQLKTKMAAGGDWTNITADIMKATTTRGAQMVINLNKAAITASRIQVSFFRTHDGVTGVDETTAKNVCWRASLGTSATTNNIYVVLSVSKEHLFISIEGPRAHDVQPYSTTYGSSRSYLFMADVVPYHATDATPAVAVYASNLQSGQNTVAGQDHLVMVSRDAANGTSWVASRLATLQFPEQGGPETLNINNLSTVDSTYYLWPYVVMEEEMGIRGRLNNIFHVGWNWQSNSADTVPPVQVGRRVSYDSKTFKTVAASKGDANSNVWGALGGVTTNSATVAFRSPVIALPIA